VRRLLRQLAAKKRDRAPSARGFELLLCEAKTLPANAVDAHFARETRALQSSRLRPNEARKNLQP